MPEKRPFENSELVEPTPRPNLLDVVKIDGRWAQVKGAGNYVTHLDDNSWVAIKWDDFKLTKDWKGLSVIVVKGSTDFTEKELKRIHWGPEQEQHPELREAVSVFGEFEKKSEKK